MKTKTLRNKADKLLTPIIKQLHPDCILCGAPTQVAHHHVHKSKSSILRYNLDNLIPLCTGCHLKLHHNESYWASKIVAIRGLDWFRGLEKEKNKIIKVNDAWYQENLERLTKLLWGCRICPIHRFRLGKTKPTTRLSGRSVRSRNLISNPRRTGP